MQILNAEHLFFQVFICGFVREIDAEKGFLEIQSFKYRCLCAVFVHFHSRAGNVYKIVDIAFTDLFFEYFDKGIDFIL